MVEIKHLDDGTFSSLWYKQACDYSDFMQNFLLGMQNFFPGACVYSFGSFKEQNEDFNPITSDIDCGIILDSFVVTDKERYLDLAELFARSIGERKIDVQCNVLDRETSRDGRFLSYTADYVSYLNQFSAVLSGPDFRDDLRFVDRKAGKLQTAAMNLTGPSGIRQGLFFLPYTFYSKSYSDFQKKTISLLKKSLGFPRNLVWLASKGDISLVRTKRVARDALSDYLDDVDFTFFYELADTLKDSQKLQNRVKSQRSAFLYVAEALTHVEMLVDSYMKHYPEISTFEAASF